MRRATPFAIGFLETALAMEDSSSGIWPATPALDLITAPAPRSANGFERPWLQHGEQSVAYRVVYILPEHAGNARHILAFLFIPNRSAFLKQACDGDQEMQREVESLLAHEKPAEKFMGAPGPVHPATPGH